MPARRRNQEKERCGCTHCSVAIFSCNLSLMPKGGSRGRGSCRKPPRSAILVQSRVSTTQMDALQRVEGSHFRRTCLIARWDSTNEALQLLNQSATANRVGGLLHTKAMQGRLEDSRAIARDSCLAHVQCQVSLSMSLETWPQSRDPTFIPTRSIGRLARLVMEEWLLLGRFLRRSFERVSRRVDSAFCMQSCFCSGVVAVASLVRSEG